MRSVVTRLKVRCNLTEESPALSYWLYRRPLAVRLKNNPKQNGILSKRRNIRIEI
jgi:hypothetical protein